MVHVRDTPPLPTDVEVDLVDWLQRLAARHAWDTRKIAAVTAAAELVAANAPAALTPGFAITEILADLYMDAEGLAAGMCYRAVRRATLALPVVSAKLGEGVAKLIDGVLRMAIIRKLSPGLGTVNAFSSFSFCCFSKYSRSLMVRLSSRCPQCSQVSVSLWFHVVH